MLWPQRVLQERRQVPGSFLAGQDSKARDPNAFVGMVRGLCKKIAGGSLTKGA